MNRKRKCLPQKAKILNSLAKRSLSAEELSHELKIGVRSIQRRLDELLNEKAARVSGWFLSSNRLKKTYGSGEGPSEKKPTKEEIKRLKSSQATSRSRKSGYETHIIELHKEWERVLQQVVSSR